MALNFDPQVSALQWGKPSAEKLMCKPGEGPVGVGDKGPSKQTNVREVCMHMAKSPGAKLMSFTSWCAGTKTLLFLLLARCPVHSTANLSLLVQMMDKRMADEFKKETQRAQQG